MSHIVILGSCVTRDIFRIVGEQGLEIDYYARTSLVSQMSEPLAIDEKDIKLDSPFQRRMILQDFKKDFFNTLRDDSVIVLDFIDERFSLLQHEQSYVVKSKEFDNGQVSNVYPFTELSRNSDYVTELWKASCLRFIEVLRENFKGRVILHEAYWAKTYLDADGNRNEFTYQRAINNENELLNKYYKFFLQAMPECEVIAQECIADVNHTWGLSAYHYTDGYYTKVHELLGI